MVIVLLFGGYYFYNSQQKVQAPQEKINTEQKVPVEKDVEEMVVENTKAREIIIEGNEFKFSPTSITVEKGEKINLVFKNIGKFPHDFVVDELGIKTKVINSGEEDSVEFIAEKSGSFSMYCSVGNHRQQGMEGKAVVE